MLSPPPPPPPPPIAYRLTMYCCLIRHIHMCMLCYTHNSLVPCPFHLTHHECTHYVIGVTKALKSMNRRMNLPNLQKIMMEFERESEIMDLKEETISDTIDDVIGDADDEEVGAVCHVQTF